MVDFMAVDLPCMFRMVELTRPVVFSVEIEKGWKICQNGARYQNTEVIAGILAYADAGISVYEHAPYPSYREINHQFLALGNGELKGDMSLVLKEGVSCWSGSAERSITSVFKTQSRLSEGLRKNIWRKPGNGGKITAVSELTSRKRCRRIRLSGKRSLPPWTIRRC